jgi:hypothetical protein
MDEKCKIEMKFMIKQYCRRIPGCDAAVTDAAGLVLGDE